MFKHFSVVRFLFLSSALISVVNKFTILKYVLPVIIQLLTRTSTPLQFSTIHRTTNIIHKKKPTFFKKMEHAHIYRSRTVNQDKITEAELFLHFLK